MHLPALRNPPSKHPLTSGEGEWAKQCERCPLRDECIRCRGRTDCRQYTCFRECGSCGGSQLDIDQDRVDSVPAICVKSPLRDLYIGQVKKDRYHFTKRERIHLKKKSIIVTQGSAGRVSFPLYPDDVEAVAVNIRHVWSQRGFFSRDMRDYLRIPNKDVKVILLTTTLDDVLERAWANNVYDEDFGALGFDYWHALDFSAYQDMSHCYNIWTGYRSLYAIEHSGAHFSFVPPRAVSRRQPRFEKSPWVRAAKAVPNLYVHMQWVKMSGPDDVAGVEAFRHVVSSVRRWLDTTKVEMTLWFMGVVSAQLVYNLKRSFPDNDCYFLAVNPWLASHKGDEFTLDGKLRKSKLPKPELILRNQQHYAKLVGDAVRAARREQAHT